MEERRKTARRFLQLIEEEKNQYEPRRGDARIIAIISYAS